MGIQWLRLMGEKKKSGLCWFLKITHYSCGYLLSAADVVAQHLILHVVQNCCRKESVAFHKKVSWNTSPHLLHLKTI